MSEFKKKGDVKLLTQTRTFGGDLPKHIKKSLSDDELEQLKGKDIEIVSYHEIIIL